MVIDVNASSPTSSRPSFKADAFTLKIVVVILFGVSFMAILAYLRNGQRNLTEDIRRQELCYDELLNDLQAEKSRWHMCNTTPAISQKLAARGFTVGLPEASHVVYVEPLRGHRRGGAPRLTSAIASR